MHHTSPQRHATHRNAPQRPATPRNATKHLYSFIPFPPRRFALQLVASRGPTLQRNATIGLWD
jgi:hypothetical protein